MSTKRTAAESCCDEQTNEGSDAVFQQDDNAKRAKLASLSRTKLRDLPNELLECILVRAVAMEVTGMKMVKSVWKEKVDLVISRLSVVCARWCSILTTDIFRDEVNTYLEETAQKTIRLETLHRSPILSFISGVTSMKDELFMLCKPNECEPFINVYDRNNMADVKDVIPLPSTSPVSMAASSVSNCVYVLSDKALGHISVTRVAKHGEHRFKLSPFILDTWLPRPIMTVTANGSVVLSRQECGASAVISVYKANGYFDHAVRLKSEISDFSDIIEKSDGHLILVSSLGGYLSEGKKLTEIDKDGIVLRQYQSSLGEKSGVCVADIAGRIGLFPFYAPKGVMLLDPEFNLLYCSGPQPNNGPFVLPYSVSFNSQRNEVAGICGDKSGTSFLIIFRFTEE